MVRLGARTEEATAAKDLQGLDFRNPPQSDRIENQGCADVDRKNPHLTNYPDFAQATGLHVTVGLGDGILLPVG